MRKLLVVVSLFSAVAMAETITGTVSDEKCGAKHTAASAKDKSCVETCVKGGAAAVIVSGDKIYKLAADSQDKVKSHLGEKVTVNGKVEGDTITVDTVETASS
jgi:hypothetical protein